jgi:hypothetical protein
METDLSLGSAPAVADPASATVMPRADELLRVRWLRSRPSDRSARRSLSTSCQAISRLGTSASDPYPSRIRRLSSMTRVPWHSDWCPGPARTSSLVGRLRELKVFDTSQVLYDVLAVGIPHVDAVSEMGAIVYRHHWVALSAVPVACVLSRFFALASNRRESRNGLSTGGQHLHNCSLRSGQTAVHFESKGTASAIVTSPQSRRDAIYSIGNAHADRDKGVGAVMGQRPGLR